MVKFGFRSGMRFLFGKLSVLDWNVLDENGSPLLPRLPKLNLGWWLPVYVEKSHARWELNRKLNGQAQLNFRVSILDITSIWTQFGFTTWLYGLNPPPTGTSSFGISFVFTYPLCPSMVPPQAFRKTRHSSRWAKLHGVAWLRWVSDLLRGFPYLRKIIEKSNVLLHLGVHLKTVVTTNDINEYKCLLQFCPMVF